ncbi:hypothetical protein [Streptomyces sp. NPDC058735]
MAPAGDEPVGAARGHRYLQVAASGRSRPLLERRDLLAPTSTTPYADTP